MAMVDKDIINGARLVRAVTFLPVLVGALTNK